jgi:hypothetical protein
MKKNMFLAAFVVAWTVVTLTVAVAAFAQDESLENVTTLDGKVVPGAGVFRREFIVYGTCYMLDADASKDDTYPAKDKLACVTIKGQFVCLGWKDYATFTFFPIDRQHTQAPLPPPFDAVGFSSDEKNYPSGQTYHLTACLPEEYE